jgi:hypothetical protein
MVRCIENTVSQLQLLALVVPTLGHLYSFTNVWPDLQFTWAWVQTVGGTIQLKSAPSSPSRSPTPYRFKHSHLASRVSQGERLVARMHAHPRSMGPKMDSLLYAILGSDRQILKGVEARSVVPAV